MGELKTVKCLWRDGQGLCHPTSLIMAVDGGRLVDAELHGSLGLDAYLDEDGETDTLGWGDMRDGPCVVVRSACLGAYLVPANRWADAQAWARLEGRS